MFRGRNAPILAKLLAVAAIAVLGVVVISYGRVSAIRPSEMEARQVKIRNLVESATSVIAHHHQLAETGQLTTDEAQRRAAQAVKSLRYDGVEYFWINDMTPRVVMHPMRAELVGQDVSTFKDAKGKLLYVEFVDIVRARGAGFSEYMWSKTDGSDPVPKLSYVAGFKPWGWIVGTGIYIDDVDKIVAARTRAALLQTTALLATLIVMLITVSLSISRPVRRLTDALRLLAAGETDVDLPKGRGAEIGRMVNAVEVLREGLIVKKGLENEATELRARAEDERRRTTADLTRQLEAAVSTMLNRVSDAMAGMQGVAVDLSSTTEHLAGSVHEISGRAAEATEAATFAAGEADDVGGTVTGLTAAAETIGGVIEVIRKVAEQTNLLALNATIEAARAGELGKGFAIVASEVKELAQQSAKATDDIAHEVSAIQSTSQEAAAMMGRMAETVRTLGATTHQVATAISGSGGAAESGGISVRAAASATGEVSKRIQSAADEMADEVQRLRTEFADLLDRMATSA